MMKNENSKILILGLNGLKETHVSHKELESTHLLGDSGLEFTFDCFKANFGEVLSLTHYQDRVVVWIRAGQCPFIVECHWHPRGSTTKEMKQETLSIFIVVIKCIC